MISVNKISVSFGGQELFDDVSFMVNKGDRIGLVGKNGAGKSTLLRILSMESKPDNGIISTPNKITIGYLKQDIEFVDTQTIQKEVEQSFTQISLLDSKIKSINQELNNRTDYESSSYLDLINEFNEADERFRLLGGHSIKSSVSQVLLGLGFKSSDFDRLTSEFSGGWRMRLELAKLLLQKPDVLLLDEPTNHLDIESIIWLEEWLKNYNGALILVSHDKRFLDVVTNRTIEIILGKINDYKASYSKYVDLRKDRQEKQVQSKKNQDKYIKHTKELIEKFRYKKNKAAFAQTLIKKLKKIEKIEVESDDLSALKFKFPPAPHSGKLVLKVKEVRKSYDELEVLKNVSLSLNRGEKIAFVGKNGEGKTTLAKIIVNSLDFEGEIKLGHKVAIGYYAQNQSDLLDKEKTIFQLIEESSNTENRPHVRDILGSFLFSGDDVDKKIKVLSGGERARVALCNLLLNPINLLVMDEPTNHLDMKSKDILKNALNNYDGTLIIVSHDRDFLQGLTNKVYEFKNKNIKEYFGDINTFLNEKNMEDFVSLESGNVINKQNHNSNFSKNKLDFEKRKKLDKEIRKLSNKVKALEREISLLENELKFLDSKLADYDNFQKNSKNDDFFQKYSEKQKKMSVFLKKWEKSSNDLELLNLKRNEL